MNIQQKFGHKIKVLRQQKHLSQEKLAFKAGIDRTYISDIEKGKRNVSIVYAEKLAKALGVETSKLFED